MDTAPPTARGSILDRGLAIAAVVTAVVVPIAASYIAGKYADVSARREANVRLVELAAQILREPPKPDIVDIRSWAADILDSYSGARLSPRARAALVDSVPLPGQAGLFRAGATPGRFSVVGCINGGAMCDTSFVTIVAPSILAVSLVPPSVATPIGKQVQFTTIATWSDGVQRPARINYSATGGTITPAGVFTAGQIPGVFRVVAEVSSLGLADTSEVIVSR